MQQQNFNNHSRMVPMYHYVTYTLLLVTIIGCIMLLVNDTCSAAYNGWLMLSLSLLLLLALWFARSFALKAQDRVIRAEENFRYFIATQKTLPKELTMSQIIALRFAADDEWQSLMQQAIDKNLSAKEIKKQIKNWRADYYRV